MSVRHAFISAWSFGMKDCRVHCTSGKHWGVVAMPKDIAAIPLAIAALP